MPSASLHFRLPEDEKDFEVAQNGHRYQSVLRRVASWLRNKAKYGTDGVEFYDEVRQELFTIANEVGVDIE
jgi:hypothetical protein